MSKHYLFRFPFHQALVVLAALVLLWSIPVSTALAQSDDFDGDTILDTLDADDDNDGIPDAVENGASNNDYDANPPERDLDSDGDGINDVLEAGGIDANGDGLADGTDGDGDGMIDAPILNLIHSDNDDVPDYVDIDSDNDGLGDLHEDSRSSDDYIEDFDGDGIDGLNDGDDLSYGDVDDRTTFIDSDNDGIPDFRDTESDNDGVFDRDEGGFNPPIMGCEGCWSWLDADSDGIANQRDPDDDNDGVPTSAEDLNGNGNPFDDDSDGDLIPAFLDADEAGINPTDADGDGVVNAVDEDDDGDGIPDALEDGDATVAYRSTLPLMNYVGLGGPAPSLLGRSLHAVRQQSLIDSDGDGLPDSLDADSDNDGIPDATEAYDVNGDGQPDIPPSGNDADGDGLDDAYDVDQGGTAAFLPDSDGDGIVDYLDMDDDGDGLRTLDESGDPDGDGLPAYLDSSGDTPAASQEGVQYKLAYENGVYTVYMRPTSTPGAPNRTLTAQVTIKVPHGSGSDAFWVNEITNLVPGTAWSVGSRIDAPTESPDADYISFDLSFPGNDQGAFNWSGGQEVAVFSFRNSNGCMGNVALLDPSDPFMAPNSVGTNPGNQIDIVDLGSGNAYLGNYETGGADCRQQRLQLKLLLQGAYESASGWMRGDLRNLSDFPTSEPYSALSSFSHVGDGGGETLAPDLLSVSGDDAIVDWILVELRSASDPSQVVATQAALLQRDGDVVAADGSATLTFQSLSSSELYVAVRHRNHLGAMTADPVLLGQTAQLVDFSDPNTATYGTHAQHARDGRHLLWSGDINRDGQIIAAGPNNDTVDILLPVLSADGNSDQNQNYVVTAYLSSDLNMDGYTIYSGPNNERNTIQISVLLHPDNTSLLSNFIVNQQLP